MTKSKLVLLKDASTALERTGGRGLLWSGKPTLKKTKLGIVIALIDGTVLIRVGDRDRGEGERDYELTVLEAEELERALVRARLAAEQQLDRLSNRSGWRVVDRKDDMVKLAHAPHPRMPVEQRWFRKSYVGHGRHAVRCQSCQNPQPPGAVVYRAATKDGWGDSTFKNVRICEPCTQEPTKELRVVES